MKKYILYILSILFISCGIPDVTSIRLDMNQPFITRLVPGDKKVTVYFESQNSEPAFSGYNIYFGDNLTPRRYKMYNQQQQLPSITSARSDVVNSFSYEIKIGGYFSTNNKNIYQLEDVNIPNGVPLYVWVSSYQITPASESSYYNNHIETATPRPELLNQTVSSGENVIIEGGIVMLNVISKAGELYFKNTATSSIIEVSAKSLYDINLAPTNGYSPLDFKIKKDRLYQVKITTDNNNRYGKVFVRDVNATSALLDYCLQTTENIRSY